MSREEVSERERRNICSTGSCLLLSVGERGEKERKRQRGGEGEQGSKMTEESTSAPPCRRRRNVRPPCFLFLRPPLARFSITSFSPAVPGSALGWSPLLVPRIARRERPPRPRMRKEPIEKRAPPRAPCKCFAESSRSMGGTPPRIGRRRRWPFASFSPRLRFFPPLPLFFGMAAV